jgi:hypothetical protein
MASPGRVTAQPATHLNSPSVRPPDNRHSHRLVALGAAFSQGGMHGWQRAGQDAGTVGEAILSLVSACIRSLPSQTSAKGADERILTLPLLIRFFDPRQASLDHKLHSFVRIGRYDTLARMGCRPDA